MGRVGGKGVSVASLALALEEMMQPVLQSSFQNKSTYLIACSFLFSFNSVSVACSLIVSRVSL